GGNGSEEVAGAIGDRGVRDLLRPEPGPREIPVGESWSKLVSDDRLQRAEADVELAPAMVCGPVDGFGRNFGLVDRRHRLWVISDPGAAPAELRRVHSRQLHHRDPDLAAV